MTSLPSALVPLVCPDCKAGIVADGQGWKCPDCARPFTYNQDILSFLTPDERFNESIFEEQQIAAWTQSARLRERIRASRLLTFINDVRIRFSLSGRRDRVFLKEMKGRGQPVRTAPSGPVVRAPDEGPLILDLGCGGGRHYFCDYGRVIGIDPVLPLLQLAKRIYSEVYQTSGFRLPFANDSFDYVVSSDVLGHIPFEHKDQLFSEIFRVLKHGGRTVHCSEADSINPWFRFAKKHPELFAIHFVNRPGHISLELPTQIRARLLRHGFREIAFKRLNSTIQEPGTLAALFDNEYRTKSRVISALVSMDKLLNCNFALREMINFLLEPLAQIEDRLFSIDYTSGALVVYEKP